MKRAFFMLKRQNGRINVFLTVKHTRVDAMNTQPLTYFDSREEFYQNTTL